MKKYIKWTVCFLAVLILTAGSALPAGAAQAKTAAVQEQNKEDEFFKKFEFYHAAPVLRKPRILLVGNSFTRYNNFSGALKKICKNQGIDADITTVTVDGHFLYQYAYPDKKPDKQSSEKLKKYLKQKWDYVVIQDRRFAPLSGVNEMYKAVDKLHSMIIGAGAQMVLLMTWAPEDGALDYQGPEAIAPDREAYQLAVMDAYYDLTNEYGAAVSPAGIAFTRALALYPGLSLYKYDKTHPSEKGSYLSACVLYATLFGKDPRKITYYPTLSGLDRSASINICQKLQALAADVTTQSDVYSASARVRFSSEEVVAKAGRKISLSYKITPQTANSRIISWKSDNTEVARVDQDGNVWAKTAGTATITVKLNNNRETSCKIFVVPAQIKMSTNETYVLDALSEVQWSSSAPKVVRVNGQRLKGVATGRAVINGTTEAGTQIRITVIVSDNLKYIEVPREMTIQVGNPEILTVRSSAGNVTYTSSNPSVVSVDRHGLLTAQKAGTVKITARLSSGKRAVCRVKAVVPIREISFQSGNKMLHLKSGESEQLKVNYAPDNASVKKLIWESDNENVLSVTDNGKIWTWNKGTATVTATTTDGTDIQIKIKVKVE